MKNNFTNKWSVAPDPSKYQSPTNNTSFGGHTNVNSAGNFSGNLGVSHNLPNHEIHGNVSTNRNLHSQKGVNEYSAGINFKF